MRYLFTLFTLGVLLTVGTTAQQTYAQASPAPSAATYTKIKPAIVDFSEVSYDNAPALALTFSVPVDGAKPFNEALHVTDQTDLAVAGEWILAKKWVNRVFSDD